VSTHSGPMESGSVATSTETQGMGTNGALGALLLDCQAELRRRGSGEFGSPKFILTTGLTTSTTSAAGIITKEASCRSWVLGRIIGTNGGAARLVRCLGVEFEVEVVRGRLELRALNARGRVLERAIEALRAELSGRPASA
jgi:hypothetical protein